MALRPASLAALAVRRASDPVQLLAEVAGHLSLIAAVMRLHRASIELLDNQPGLKVRCVFPKE